MKIYDEVYDNESYIHGIIIDKADDGWYVLWDNCIIGKVKDEYTEVEFKRHLDIHKYKIIDILYTEKSGIELESKIGDKYNKRRNKNILIDVGSLVVGKSFNIYIFNTDDYNELIHENADVDNKYVDILHTTRFVSMYDDEDYTMIRTLNSIYRLKPVI